ncbi:trans-sulfuration enzyme family protein [Pantoea sp. App145]|uniref:trans-sulfuration enzyme family protein n=1 Tax=Pantoea sp. App145 TaxID=3071567 RepID=UPI003A8033FD
MEHVETLLAGLDHFTDDANGGLVPAIQPAVTSQILPGQGALHYARSGNSTSRLAEKLMTKLESGAEAALFNSGVSAAWAVLSTLKHGDSLIVEEECYYEFRNIMLAYCTQHQIQLIFVDLNDNEALEQVLRCHQVNVVWAETATNPLWKVIDIAQVAALVHRYQARLVVDATVSTPLAINPLQLGADIVLHSATKYLNGHGDLTAGFLVTREVDEWWELMMWFRTSSGTVLQTLDAWMLLRGMRTLALRFRHACDNAEKLAQALLQHPAVREVHYPGLEGDPWYSNAQRQMNGFYGAMLSFRLHGGVTAASLISTLTRTIRHSTSLGSTESLIEHRQSTEGDQSRCPADLVRLSVGIENSDDLIADMQQALDAISLMTPVYS